MNINIAMIKINYISNIGSLNIGKTILCKNNASSAIDYPISGANQEVEKELAVEPITVPIEAPITPST